MARNIYFIFLHNLKVVVFVFHCSIGLPQSTVSSTSKPKPEVVNEVESDYGDADGKIGNAKDKQKVSRQDRIVSIKISKFY